MGRWSMGDAAWREDYRKVSRTMSLPEYLVKDLEAHGKPSAIVTEVLENHKDAIGDGVYKKIQDRRRERLSIIIEDLMKEKLADNIRALVKEAVDRYVDSEEGK